MADTSTPVRAPRAERFEERRQQLAESALETLGRLGYARTSLRDIADSSDFTHGVLHYYFTDKVELIAECVRLFHQQVVTSFDELLEREGGVDDLIETISQRLVRTLVADTANHRLWYDLRTQSMFDDTFRDDVRDLERSLEGFTWRVVSRYAELVGVAPVLDPASVYALFDGLFLSAVLAHTAGDPEAASRFVEQATWLVQQVCPG